MEKVFFVMNGDLEEVNHELSIGGKVKFICPVAESVSITGKQDCRPYFNNIVGNTYAYVVIEYDNPD